jgi:hypothetical protein
MGERRPKDGAFEGFEMSKLSSDVEAQQEPSS